MVDEIAEAAHDAERIAAGKAIDLEAHNDSHIQLRHARERLDSRDFNAKLSEVREKLKVASGF